MVCFFKLQSGNLKMTLTSQVVYILYALYFFVIALQFCKFYNFAVSPLQPRSFDTQIILYKNIATLMTDGFSLADTKLEVYKK